MARAAKSAEKAAPAKTAAPAAKAPSGRSKADKFLAAQLKLLEEERATYSAQADALQAEADLLAQDRDAGDAQFDEEGGEGDTITVERERDLALSAQARQAVAEIDRAIEKMEAGTYGICEVCKQPIPPERLEALPSAALCVKCKSSGLGQR